MCYGACFCEGGIFWLGCAYSREISGSLPCFIISSSPALLSLSFFFSLSLCFYLDVCASMYTRGYMHMCVLHSFVSLTFFLSFVFFLSSFLFFRRGSLQFTCCCGMKGGMAYGTHVDMYCICLCMSIIRSTTSFFLFLLFLFCSFTTFLR